MPAPAHEGLPPREHDPARTDKAPLAGASPSADRRPRIADPRAVPVEGADAHLPAIAPHRLEAAALRQRLGRALEWLPELPGDGGAAGPGEPMLHAAVLVPLVCRDDGLRVLLTRRTEHLRDHAGQISFPGGRREDGDAGPEATALREAQEEVGLDPATAEVIGRLPDYLTVTRFVVTPVVALVRPPVVLSPDPFEVAEAFEVPLAFLMDPANHRRHRFEHDGAQRQFLSMPWQATDASGAVREYFIWGATAAMLRNLYAVLAR